MSQYILLVLLAIAGTRACAQFQVWRHFDASTMSNTNIVGITEDKNGLLYLATHGGVNIFDGRRFHPVEVPNVVGQGINPFVNQMRWGRNGLLWVCTRTHIYTYNPANGGVRLLFGSGAVPSVGNIEVDTLHNILYFVSRDSLVYGPLNDTLVTVTAQLRVGSVLESRLTKGGELYLLTDRNKVLKLYGNELVPVFEEDGIVDIDYSLKDDAIIALTKTGLYRIDCKTGRIDKLPQKVIWAMESLKTRISTLPGGRLLVQHQGGVDMFAGIGDTSCIRFTANEQNTGSLKADFVICSFEDSRGNLWVCEDGIVLSVLPANAASINYVSAAMTGATRLWASFHDKVGKQVFTSSEFGICRFRYGADTPAFTRGIRPRGLKFFEPMAFCEWNRGELLVLTNGQGPWLLNTRTYALRPFDTLIRHGSSGRSYGVRKLSGEDYLFFGPQGVFKFNRRTGVFCSPPTDSISGESILHGSGAFAAMQDSKGDIWVADGEYVHVWDSALRPIKKYRGKSADHPSGLSNTVVMDMMQGPDGRIYVATMGGGLHKLTAADTFEHVNLVEDIAAVFCIGQIDERHLVITSGSGLMCYDVKTGESRVLSRVYGMPVWDFNQLALAVDDTFVAAAGTTGYIVASKKGLLSAFKDTARVVLMKGAMIVEKLVLNKGERTLELSVAIPGYLAEANWQLRYKLEGVDDEWRMLGKGEWEIRYNSIKPGEYTLRVEALDRQNVINAQSALVHIAALPFFWETTGFRVLLLAVGLTLLVAIVRFFSQMQLRWKLKKMENEQKVARERIRISRELHDNVGSQLTYLITGLESSNLLLRKQDTQKLEQKLDKMQASARESMQQLRDSIWALNNESVQVSVLISRFRQWMEHIMEAAPEMHYSISGTLADDVSLDPIRSLNLFRILQEAVHNVLKHSKAKTVQVTYKCEKGELTATVEDDGVGFKAGASAGNGQKTMVARAEEAGGRVEVISVPGEGTRVLVSFLASGF